MLFTGIFVLYVGKCLCLSFLLHPNAARKSIVSHMPMLS